MARTIFVTGTDTSIGKTVVAAHLMQTLIGTVPDPLYIKPVQTGVDSFEHPDSDAWYVGRFCDAPQRAVWVRWFKNPKAPYYAALDEQTDIDVPALLSDIGRLSEGRSHVVLEGAGGLLVPVTEDYMNADLIRDTADTVLVVARAALGTINHTLMTLDVLRKRAGDKPVVVILNDLSGTTPRDLIMQNADAIQRFGGVDHVYALPHIGAGQRWPMELFSPMMEPLL